MNLHPFPNTSSQIISNFLLLQFEASDEANPACRVYWTRCWTNCNYLDNFLTLQDYRPAKSKRTFVSNVVDQVIEDVLNLWILSQCFRLHLKCPILLWLFSSGIIFYDYKSHYILTSMYLLFSTGLGHSLGSFLCAIGNVQFSRPLFRYFTFLSTSDYCRDCLPNTLDTTVNYTEHFGPNGILSVFDNVDRRTWYFCDNRGY